MCLTNCKLHLKKKEEALLLTLTVPLLSPCIYLIMIMDINIHIYISSTRNIWVYVVHLLPPTATYKVTFFYQKSYRKIYVALLTRCRGTVARLSLALFQTLKALKLHVHNFTRRANEWLSLTFLNSIMCSYVTALHRNDVEKDRSRNRSRRYVLPFRAIPRGSVVS